MDDWGGSGRGNYRPRGSRGFGGSGGRHNDNYYGGRGGRSGSGYYDGGGPGGYYDGPQGGRGGRGGGRGAYIDSYQGGQKRQQQQQYNANPPPNLTLLKTIQAHSGPITCMSYDQATNALFTGAKDGKVKQWDCNSGQVVHEETLGGQVDSILFIQGFLFVAYVKGPDPRNQDGIINFYNTAAGKTQMIPGHRGHINQMLASNNLLFSCGQDCSIRVWGMEGEAFVCKQILDKDKGGHTYPIYAFEMINGFLVSGDSFGSLKIWDPATGTCTQTVTSAHNGTITSILQYGNNILTGSVDGYMKVWELMSPPVPGAVVKPEAIDSYFEDDGGGRSGGGGGRYRQGGGGPHNSILTMDGSPDNKGESILAISTLQTGVNVYNVDQSMSLLGMLPGVVVSRAITNIPGAAIIVGDDTGKVHIFSWSG
ncbi:hypothetical protein VOLCADRAFT_88519 [Volvox carteri f. nagariensis]|uniref:Uncharacterized protein n=1 Tax=Volvox carteri f. nagariensis TaxID=3068 RepID=D8TP79_VOLCA|nr:uncharacterized protein VOLCADRAFT_88519 [Volvox carteri f. nagariensis]EFJ50572.1 hypothetical protein VOLCADRAFT_88519 [Volvox carteri f. nagariensis]|eukprot:XP_002948165.1 hypothetical protein VOLCADRAFT_88519 [Volvox carteri f. nagariensis]